MLLAKMEQDQTETENPIHACDKNILIEIKQTFIIYNY